MEPTWTNMKSHQWVTCCQSMSVLWADYHWLVPFPPQLPAGLRADHLPWHQCRWVEENWQQHMAGLQRTAHFLWGSTSWTSNNMRETTIKDIRQTPWTPCFGLNLVKEVSFSGKSVQPQYTTHQNTCCENIHWWISMTRPSPWSIAPEPLEYLEFEQIFDQIQY